MSLRFNGIEIPTSGDVTFGGGSFNEVRFNGVTFWLKGDAGGPPVPSFCNASDDIETHIRVQWGYSNYQAGYAVYKSLDNVNYDFVAMVTNGDLYYDDYNVQDSTVYWYKVKACWLDDITECSAFTQADDGQLKSPDTVTPPANPPENLIASDGTYFDKVIVSWQNGGETDATAVNIYRNDTLVATTPFGPTTFIDNAVDPGMTYEYYATFRNAGGEGPESNRDEGSTSDQNQYVLRTGDSMTQDGSGLVSPSLRVSHDGITEYDVWHAGNFDPDSKPTGSWTWDGTTLRITIPTP